MGVIGAAIAIMISRILECVGIVTATYLTRSPVAAGLKELLDIDWAFIVRVLKPVLPVALNEILWSLGITTYNALYAHIGTESIAAVNMLSTIENLAWAFMNGISLSTAVMVGHRIGRGEEERGLSDRRPFAGDGRKPGCVGGRSGAAGRRFDPGAYSMCPRLSSPMLIVC